jgi:capsular polysaccharide biosynthesis protein
MATLRESGFVGLELTNLTFLQQISAFRNARIVLGPHGAGLTNLTFCRPGTVCIELLSQSYVSDLYAVVANIVGIDHRYIIASGPGPYRERRSNDDFTLELAVLARALKRLDRS